MAAFSATMPGSSSHQNSDATLREILVHTRTIALVGASTKLERPASYVMKNLLDQGYKVIPVNPGLAGQTIYDQTVYGTLADIPEQVIWWTFFAIRKPQDR